MHDFQETLVREIFLKLQTCFVLPGLINAKNGDARATSRIAMVISVWTEAIYNQTNGHPNLEQSIVNTQLFVSGEDVRLSLFSIISKLPTI